MPDAAREMKTRIRQTPKVRLAWLAAGVCCVSAFAALTSANSPPAVNVQIVSDEADNVLAILGKKKAAQAISAADWQHLFATEGYVRLKKREIEIGRQFSDDDFKAFVLSDDLAGRAPALAETLARWKAAQITAAAERALAYLPRDAHIRARIYPVIKPATNSFVFETKTDPAIFLFLDPATTREQFENTLAHELHHIGYSGSCAAAEPTGLPDSIQPIANWASAFGEGVAMLAAAGGPDTHPHATSKAEDRARWDRDLANFNQDLKKVEQFFLDILEKRLSDPQKIRETGFSFFGVQGPWYTVGWKMSVTIEKAYGRQRLIDSLCDPRRLLITYNEAAARANRSASEPLAVWSPALIDALRKDAK